MHRTAAASGRALRPARTTDPLPPGARRLRRRRGPAVACLLLLLGGCAAIDRDYPRQRTVSLGPAPGTRLAATVAPLLEKRPAAQSGFHVLSDGIDALALRLLLAARAESSIDLQYYLIKNDLTGRALVATLLEAADRGVRVRLLLDDVFTAGYDRGLAALHAHPNIALRIFNPFRRGALGRVASGLTDFRRINRRMHNKSFSVDGQVTIVGGRNIADEYFGARADARFSDLDVLGLGPVVADVSRMFDRYWNHEAALPVPAFARMPAEPVAALAQLRRRVAGWKREIAASAYAAALERQAAALFTAPGQLTWAPYALVYDSPDKGVPSRADDAPRITAPLADAFRSARDRVLLISPYFVPGRSGVAALGSMEARGVDVTVVTNALAANNQFAVHAGYAPARRPLLRRGVALYETRPDAEVASAELIAAGGARATLHTKAFVIDRREVFIGSFNFDPRSANLNTESGVIIRSPALAEDLLALADAALPQQSYRLFLDERDRLRWRERRDGREHVWTHEPRTRWWARSVVTLMRLLPIRSQL